MSRPIFEKGIFDGAANRGWVVGQFIGGARHTSDVEVKWANEREGLVSAAWRVCGRATTLSVLVKGNFKIEFRSPADGFEATVDLDTPGAYVIFGPGIQHRSTALEDSVFLTIRWPSIDGDCRPIE
jgi:hypothetical protein